MRRFNIEPNLMPLLRLMHEAAGGKGKVLSRTGLSQSSKIAREHLRIAGVERPELFINDSSRKNLGFHELRATGLTWMAIRKDNPLAIQTRAGHTSLDTTQAYTRLAETVGPGNGELFPPLPKSLIEP